MTTPVLLEAQRLVFLARRIECGRPALTPAQVLRLRRSIDDFTDEVREILGPLE